MKNKNILVLIISLLLVSGGINIYQFTKLNNQAESVVKLTEEVKDFEESYTPIYQYFTSLTVTDFEKKVASGERFTVYIGRPDCGDCNTFEPALEELIEANNLESKLYYLNVKWIRAADKDNWQKFKDTYGFTQTPAFITFENGKQVSMIEWTDKGLTKSELENWLQEQGII